jgi:uncharacterized lipoprotein
MGPRLIAALLAGLLVVGCVAGCGGDAAQRPEEMAEGLFKDADGAERQMPPGTPKQEPGAKRAR